ncbi:MAG TPA: HAMP domain-containing sensor histidine kinase [Dehalococcoidia bacterium]|nr:HAMP domain-containing sensor histidine kinase [Dehalococcoidia bacterium]
MFKSLRIKLAVAFGLIALLSVAAVGTGSLLLLRSREVQAARQRVGDLLPPEAAAVSMLAQRGWPQDRIASYLRLRADELKTDDNVDVRFILLDDDSNVIVDTAGRQSGHFTALSNGKSGRNLTNSYHVTGYKEAGTVYTAFYQPSGQLTLTKSPAFVAANYNVVMLVPEASISSAWFDLAPRLGVAAALALVAALTAAYFVARSVTRPLARVTHASEAMAKGEYEQQIRVEGRDEVARLARSFNGMAAQVSHSHQMMRDLLANVAHELKTPLTSIQGFSQALADGALQSPDEYASAGRIINEESERMRRLVNDLLYLSQIESGQATLDRQPVDLGALLDATSERVRWQLADEAKTLSVVTAPGLPMLLLDPLRMEQVLGNLVDNALRFTPAGGAITLSAAPTPAGGARIDVHNTGSYISPEEQERIFERFYQVDRSRRRNGHNGGLGLAIAAQIAAAHGGTLTVHSDRETGTTFSIVLPRYAPAAAQDSAARGGGMAGVLPAGRMEGQRA